MTLACAMLGSALVPLANADDELNGVTAVSAKVSPDYVRKEMPDGSFQPEYYAFGEGGHWAGQISDETIDNLKFLDVAHVIAVPLAERKYIPARDPKKTNLLIMLYWGTTAVPENSSNSMAYEEVREAMVNLGTPKAGQDIHSLGSGNSKQTMSMRDDQLAAWSAAVTMMNMVNQERAREDFTNAMMIGYDAAGLIGTEHGLFVRGTAFGWERQDLVNEIEENRYFVVLMAYDFQLLWGKRQHKLLWETRFSVSEVHNQFDKALPLMARYASQFFGEPSNGLVRTRVPNADVEIRPPTLIDLMDQKK